MTGKNRMMVKLKINKVGFWKNYLDTLKSRLRVLGRNVGEYPESQYNVHGAVCLTLSC